MMRNTNIKEHDACANNSGSQSNDSPVADNDEKKAMASVNIAPPDEAVKEDDLLAKLRIPFYLALNGCSSVGIVFANKVVFQVYNFKYGTLLTFMHFVFTFLGLEVCRRLGVFERKDVNIKSVLPLCVSFCGFVALTNLSLVYNSVGFYQLMKVLTTPLLVIIQTLFYGEHFSGLIKASLSLTCLGVAIATVTAVKRTSSEPWLPSARW